MASYKDFLEEVPEYILKVKQYAKLLINEQIWDAITHDDIDAWLGNFENSEEKLLAGLLLEGLVYRSAQQTKSLLANAIDVAVSSAIYPDPLEALRKENFFEILTSRNIRKDIKIVPVIRDSDPPTKSGPSIARLYKRALNVSEGYMIWPWLIDKYYKEGARRFILIDDTLATGQQFFEFFKQVNHKKFSGCSFIYIPLLAHKRGVDNIAENFPELIVSPVEVVDDSYSFFRAGKAAQIEDLDSLYMRVARKHLNRRLFNKMARGYEGLALTFSYYHSTPNASLPLYWYEDDKFSPLVRR